MTLVTAGIGAFGVLSLTDLSAITYLSNFGTFMLYGVTCLIAVYALSREKRSVITKYVIPIAGLGSNVVMLIAVIWLATVGGGATQLAGFIAVAAVALWMGLGLLYYWVNSRSRESTIFPHPGGK